MFLDKTLTVNLRISAQGTYFKFRRRQGTLIREGRLFEGGCSFKDSGDINPDWIIQCRSVGMQESNIKLQGFPVLTSIEYINRKPA